MAKCGIMRKIKAIGGGMNGKNGFGMRGLIWMVLEKKSVFVLEPFVGHRHARRIIGPAIPRPVLNRPKHVGRAPDWAAAAFIVAIISDVKLVAKEREAEWISETPGDQFGLTPLGPDAHDRSAARHLAFDHLPGGCRRTKWHECASGRSS